MHVGDSQWRSIITEGAQMGGVAINDQQLDMVVGHAQALLSWNRKINLTAIVDPMEIAVKHFLDAILPHPFIPTTGRLLDIGTGGGFPGIPLKVLRPAQPMLLIDKVRKKISFVRDVIRRLNLENISADQLSVEDLVQKKDTLKEGFDTIVCRALKDPASAARMAAPCLAPGGKLFVYQGPGDNWSTKTLDHEFGVSNVFSYRLPFIGDRRTVVVIVPN